MVDDDVDGVDNFVDERLRREISIDLGEGDLKSAYERGILEVLCEQRICLLC